MLGNESDASHNFTPLSMNEIILLSVISCLIIIMGVYPKPLLELAEPTLQSILLKAGIN